MAGTGGTDGGTDGSTDEVFEFEIHATDAEDALYKWVCKLPVNEPLKTGRSKWASVFNIPEAVVGFEDSDRRLLDLSKTPPQAGLAKTGGVVFAVPLDEKWTEAGGGEEAVVSKPGKVAADAPEKKAATKTSKEAKPAAAKPAAGGAASKAATGSKRAAADGAAAPPAKKAKDAAASAAPARNSGTVPSGDDPIVFLATNPKRAGSSAYDRYEKYKTAKTPNEALNAGAIKGDLGFDWKKGYFKRA